MTTIYTICVCYYVPKEWIAARHVCGGSGETSDLLTSAVD